MMRPTRWTRQRRVTWPGKGGWSLRHGLSYTNPITGHGVSVVGRWAPFALPRVLQMRREQERQLRRAL